MHVKRWWAVVPALLLTLSLLFAQGSSGRVALAETKTAEWKMVVDGRTIAGFTEVSGLGIEYQMVESVCRNGSDGRDDDCDGVWLAGVYQALWEMTAAVDELDRSTAVAGQTKHDTVKNAIGNIRALVRQTQDQIDGATSLTAKHDTSKNAIGNIRAAYRAFSAITVNEEGVPKAAVERMGAAVNSLQNYTDGWQHLNRRAGKAKYKNIVLRTAPGAMPPALLEWLGSGARKSGSIIYLDRDGKEVMRFNFFDCFPVRYDASQIVEEIELAVERVERSK